MLLVVVPGSGDGSRGQSQKLAARQAVVRERQPAVDHVRDAGRPDGPPRPPARAPVEFGTAAAAVVTAVQDIVELRVLHEPLGGGLPRQVVPLLGGQGLRVASHGLLHPGHEVFRGLVGQAVRE